MSLERKDLRLKLSVEIHAGLDALADVLGRNLADLAEEIISAEVRRRLHEATVLVEKATRLGISGKNGE